MQILTDEEIQSAAASSGGMTWRQVVESALKCLSPGESDSIQLKPGAEGSWFEEHRSTLDSWRTRLNIEPLDPDSRRPRFHPATINMVLVLIVGREVERKKLSDLQQHPFYLHSQEIIRNILVGKATADQPTWFHVIEQLDDDFHLSQRANPELTPEDVWREASKDLINLWRADHPDDFSANAFLAIAWTGIKTIVDKILAERSDTRLSEWRSRMANAGPETPFRLAAGVCYTVATDRSYSGFLLPETAKMFGFIFALAARTLQKDVLDFDSSDLLILNWLAGKQQEIKGAFYLRHSEGVQESQCYKIEDEFSPLSALIDDTLDRLFQVAHPLNTGLDSVRCTLSTPGDHCPITIKATYRRNCVDLEVASAEATLTEMWQIVGRQRTYWQPQSFVKSDLTTDWFIDDLISRSPDRQGLHLRLAYNGIQFVTIPAGVYSLGDRQRVGAANERPVHKVKTNAFSLSIMPMTIGFYRRFMQDCPEWQIDSELVRKTREANMGKPNYLGERDYLSVERQLWSIIDKPLYTQDTNRAEEDEAFRLNIWSRAGFDDLPVYDVPWRAAIAFCNWLSEIFQINPAYEAAPGGSWKRIPSSYGFRLPTEAEWEVAASGGGHYTYGFSDGTKLEDSELKRYTWAENPGKTAQERIAEALSKTPLGSVLPDVRSPNNEMNIPTPWTEHRPSSVGLYQMLGNVWEFTEDAYREDAYSSRYGKTTENPVIVPEFAPDKVPRRVIRGGSFASQHPNTLRASNRHSVPETHCHFIGFRIARSIPPIDSG